MHLSVTRLVVHGALFHRYSFSARISIMYQVLLFYKYVTIADPSSLMKAYRALCEKYELKGRTIIAEEGINSTLEGTTENTEKFLEEFLTDERFSDMQIKRSKGTGASFPKLMIKVRQ